MAATSAPEQGARIDSIDLLRGVVMVLMAIDHVRVYAGVPAGSPDPGVFLTRWVTHFVAPLFAFFAGTSAYLHGRKLGDVRALSRFLWTRGLVLVVLELTVIRTLWTFNFDFAHYNLAGVIWMLGWCMIFMAALVRLSTRAIGIFGLVVVMGQQLAKLLSRVLPGPLATLLYEGGWIPFGEGGLGVLYVWVPWIGVMALGYAFGTLFFVDEAQRRRRCIAYGAAATGFWLILGTVAAIVMGGAGESGEGGGAAPFWMRLLNQQKYPASQLFLGMTIGPALLVLPYVDRARIRMAQWLVTFGRVPMFYYLLHLPVIHVAAIVVSLVREGSVNPWLFGNHPFAPPEVPDDYRWSLGLLYFVWAICLVLLYFPSAWYAKVKATRKQPWMSYI